MDVIKVTGIIIEIFSEVRLSEKFIKRELVVRTQDQYPEEILIQFVQDKCQLLDNFGEGELVEVCVNLKGRSWTNPEGETKYFNTIQGWRIDAFNNVPKQTTPSVAKKSVSGIEKNFQEDMIQEMTEEDDDLPF